MPRVRKRKKIYDPRVWPTWVIVGIGWLVARLPLTAIATLANENLVEMTSRGSAFVRSFSESEFLSIWEIRAVLEGLVCRMAAKELKPQQGA